ncbi:protein transport protein S31 [Tieghemiomyces parasiticus]|uniref:Protein transport protein SEC31 n=1 Tax=Tieghemiomyces parasiticus TaxID=78921 RepID=A0A9W8A8K2_9FUNG|nr:protein transport protein S31 [Tieghemiomyces parasiticus]
MHHLEIYQLDGPEAVPQPPPAATDPNDFDFSQVAAPASSWGPVATVASSARFNRLLWSVPVKDRTLGVLAGGMANGELVLWDAQTVINGAGAPDAEATTADSVVFRSNNHTGALAGMDFNNQQKHVLATGAGNGEIYIWDLETPAKPYSPGPRSTKLEDVTSLAWNNQVTHILASASTTGYTVIWDLKNRREVMSLSYAQQLQMPGLVGGGNGNGRRGVTAVAWNPDNATQLVTATEDDQNPVVMMWDLRNAQAPERIFSGHSKGILSLSWCKMDADLLFSSGKDNRTICWNPTRGEMVGELPVSSNWVFDVQVNQHNPNLLSTASFDGKIAIHSLQSTNEGEDVSATAATAGQPTDDPFAAAIYSASATSSFSLKQPPKWYRRPVGASFGFGNQLVHFAAPSEAARATATTMGTAVPHTVAISTVVTDKPLLCHALELEGALETNAVGEFCEQRIRAASSPLEAKNWRVLKLLFENDARDKLVRFLGFDKEELRARVQAALARSAGEETPTATEMALPTALAEAATSTVPTDDTAAAPGAEVPDLSGELGDLTVEDEAPADGAAEPTTEAAATAEANPFATSGAAGGDFFEQDFTAPPADIDAAPASTAPVTTSSTTTAAPLWTTPLQLNLAEGGLDGLITEAVLIGDFDRAVEVCLRNDRFADALILASCGGADLLARTQQAYFAQQGQRASYLRLLHGVVSGDLSDVVEHAAIHEWDQILVLLCTYAQGEQFSTLSEKLGARLETAWQTQSPGNANSTLLQAAVVCYLAAGSLDSVVKIWLYLQKMQVDEEVAGGAIDSPENPEVRAVALQNLVEKVSVFRKAVDYIDTAVETPLGSAVRNPAEDPATESAGGRSTFTLAPLYDIYLDYAQWLIVQGQGAIAAKYVKRTPDDYYRPTATGQNALAILKDRLYQAGYLGGDANIPPSFPFDPLEVGADGQTHQPSAAESYPQSSAYDTAAAAAPTGNAYLAAGYGAQDYGHYPSTTAQPSYGQPPASQVPAAGQYGHYGAYGDNSAATSGYPAPAQQYPAATQQHAATGYGYGQAYQQPEPTPGYGAVPNPIAPFPNQNTGYSNQAPAADTPAAGPPPSQQRNLPAYHDPPTLAMNRKRNPSASKAAPIVAPFPNAQPSAPTPGSAPSVGPPSSHGGPGSRITSPPPPPPTGARPPQRAYRTSISKPAPASPSTQPPPPPQSGYGPPPSGYPGPPPSAGQPRPQPTPYHPPHQGGPRPGPPPHHHNPSGYPSQPQAPQQQQQQPPPPPTAQYPSQPSAYGQGPPPPPPTAQPRPPPGSGAVRPPPSGYTPRPPHPGPAGTPGYPSARPVPPRGPPSQAGPPSSQQPAGGPYPPPSGAHHHPHPGYPRAGTPQSVAQQRAHTPSASRPGTPSAAGPGAASSSPANHSGKYPPGDRSHIPDGQKIIFTALTAGLQQARAVAGPTQKRMMDDTEKRLHQLFDLMNGGDLPASLEEPLTALAHALQNRDFNQAHQVYLKLIHSNFDSSQRWMMGVKRLVETLKSVSG